MRARKALINSSANIISFFIIFLPNLLLRKIFLEKLGSDMLGLNSLYSNIIGWLSVVELGVGVAIVYSLYKPYLNDDRKKIRAYIRFFGWFYRIVGIVILIGGMLITPFLSYFINGGINIKIASIGFILFLLNSFVTYMFSNRLCILNVAQESYKLAIGTTVTKLLIILLQLLMFKIYPNFIFFIAIQLIINCMYYIVINSYIIKRYPWLNKGKEELEYNERSALIKDIKAMFMHKISVQVVYGTDSLIISKFIGLKALTNYTNYQVVISALQTIIKQGLDGLTASIGNLIASDDKNKSYEVHKKIFFMNFWLVSFIAISLYNTLNQFIALWVGEKYFLDEFTFMIIIINVYFGSMREAVEQFQTASGNFYQDRYGAVLEAIVNLIASLILVNYMGIAGVFVGTLISNLTVIFWTKPYVVYKYVFNKKVVNYYKIYFKYLLIGVIPLLVTRIITSKLRLEYNIVSFIANCIVNILTINMIYILIFYRSNEFKYCINLLKKMVNRKM